MASAKRHRVEKKEKVVIEDGESRVMMQNADDGVEDYMSDAFLASLVPNEKEKSGISSSSASKSSGKAKQQVVEKTKPRAEMERINREEGLKSEIGEDNKGFKLLNMMGYQ